MGPIISIFPWQPGRGKRNCLCICQCRVLVDLAFALGTGETWSSAFVFPKGNATDCKRIRLAPF